MCILKEKPVKITNMLKTVSHGVLYAGLVSELLLLLLLKYLFFPHVITSSPLNIIKQAAVLAIDSKSSLRCLTILQRRGFISELPLSVKPIARLSMHNQLCASNKKLAYPG